MYNNGNAINKVKQNKTKAASNEQKVNLKN